MKNLVILGSTGSIGTQALEIAEQAGDRVVGLAAARNVTLLEQQIRQFRPAVAAMYDEAAAADLPLEGLGDMLLSNHVIKGAGSPFSIQSLVHPKHLLTYFL